MQFAQHCFSGKWRSFIINNFKHFSIGIDLSINRLIADLTSSPAKSILLWEPEDGPEKKIIRVTRIIKQLTSPKKNSNAGDVDSSQYSQTRSPLTINEIYMKRPKFFAVVFYVFNPETTGC
jgi:hypothetical protein